MRTGVGGLLYRDGKVLLGRRAAHKALYPGKWDVIGGHREPGETIEQVLVRELHEELAVRAIQFECVAMFDEPDPTRYGAANYHVFVVREWQGEVKNASDEHSELAWFAIDELAAVDLAAGLYEAICAGLGPPRLMLLPGASGNTQFWQPVAELLAHRGQRVFMAWPGFGDTPPDPAVRGLDDLVARVCRQITGPVDLLAQSMGGLVALQVALARPALVKHLVLSATSGGIDVAGLGGSDWRPMFAQLLPQAPSWFCEARTDLTLRLHALTMPVLLLWGDADPISPVAVGRRLLELFPVAELLVLPGGTHDLVQERASELVPHIERHLSK